MSESLWRTSLAECRERFKELGKNCQLDCIAWSPIDGDEPPELVARQKVGFRFSRNTGFKAYGPAAGWRTFVDIARLAFECVKVAPAHVQKLAFDCRLPAFGAKNDAEWVHLVADLAARNIQGSPLTAVQLTWKRIPGGGEWVHELADLPALRKLLDGKEHGEFVDSMPTGENWFIELKDLANSSVAAIDILFALMPSDTKMPLKEPLEAGDLQAEPPKGPADQSQVVAILKPCELNAYLLYQHAEGQTERRLQDREAYDWLNANDWPEGLFPGASDYKLPTFGTWAKYVRVGRNAHGTNKHRSRAASAITRSIVRQRDLDSRRDD